MAGRQALVLMAGGVLVALGCAHSYPTPIELVEARAAYTRAEQGPAAQLATARLASAKQALSSAEQSYGRAPESEVRDWSYIAIRWIQAAEVEAEAELALQRRQRALYELAGLSGPYADRARAELAAAGIKVQPPAPAAVTQQPSAGQTPPPPPQPVTTQTEANRPPPAQAQPGQTPLETPAPVQGTVGKFRVGPGTSPASVAPSGVPATPTTPAGSAPPSSVTPPPLPTLPPPRQPAPAPASTTPPPVPSTSPPPSPPR